jgi:transcriptional regulator with XRE-family HTH domain
MKSPTGCEAHGWADTTPLGFALFSDHFVQLRREQGLSRSKLSKLAGVPEDVIRRFEERDPSSITLHQLFRLGRVLNRRPEVRFVSAAGGDSATEL